MHAQGVGCNLVVSHTSWKVGSWVLCMQVEFYLVHWGRLPGWMFLSCIVGENLLSTHLRMMQSILQTGFGNGTGKNRPLFCK